MSSQVCRRAWEAEAIEDGRLSGSSRAAFERHAAECTVCRGERAALAMLRARSEADVRPPLGELEKRRMRATLLQRANSEALRTRRPNVLPLAAAACLAMLVGSFVAWKLHARSNAISASKAAAAAPPRYDVRDVQRASWHAENGDGATFVRLDAGTAAFHVEHLERGQRFVVRVPDGELEVKGTRFFVSVSDGHTQSVQVTEGVVAMRVGGAPERLLRANERWDFVPEKSAAAPSAPPRDTKPSAAPVVSAPSVASAQEERARAGEAFAAAMTSFRGERWAEADERLERFVREHRTDGRAEDAMFLRVGVRRKMGDESGAKELARSYIRAYPRGLRVAEAQAIVDADR